MCKFFEQKGWVFCIFTVISVCQRSFCRLFSPRQGLFILFLPFIFATISDVIDGFLSFFLFPSCHLSLDCRLTVGSPSVFEAIWLFFILFLLWHSGIFVSVSNMVLTFVYRQAQKSGKPRLVDYRFNFLLSLSYSPFATAFGSLLVSQTSEITTNSRFSSIW